MVSPLEEPISPDAMPERAAAAILKWLEDKERSQAWLGKQIAAEKRIARMLKRTRPASLDDLKAIARVTGIAREVLMDWSEEGPRLEATVARRQHDTPRPHPGDWRPALRSVYGTETLLDVEAFTDRDEPRIPPAGYENQLPEGYALRVKGDSLAGLPKPIVDGDWVWIDPIQHGEHTEWPGRPHVALVRHTPDAEPVAVVKVLKGDGLYSVLRLGDGRTNEVRLDVAEILAITPVIAVERSSDPI